MKVRSMKDATTGWVTVQGNQGTVFLEQVPCIRSSVLVY